MATHTAALSMGDAAIRQLDGLYSLNDLHAAAGSERKHEPNRFLRLDSTAALINEVGAYPEMGTPLRIVNDGRNNGTYACRELVIAYAAWISAAFHLKVIRVFLAQTSPSATAQPPACIALPTEAVHSLTDSQLEAMVLHRMQQYTMLRPVLESLPRRRLDAEWEEYGLILDEARKLEDLMYRFAQVAQSLTMQMVAAGDIVGNLKTLRSRQRDRQSGLRSASAQLRGGNKP